MSSLALLLLFALPPATPQVTGEKAAPGVYRFRGEGELAGPAAPLLAMVTAYDQQCKRGCRYEVPSVDRTEILPGEREGLFYTWSYVDDLLDGAYFMAVEVAVDIRTAGARTTVRSYTPAAETLARLVDKDHPHQPFFHFQEVAWTFEESPPAPDGETRTRVTVEMEMKSDRWAVNLLPGQIVERTKNHLLLIYRYLGEAAAAGAGSR
jgi:hypothetical protein